MAAPKLKKPVFNMANPEIARLDSYLKSLPKLNPADFRASSKELAKISSAYNNIQPLKLPKALSAPKRDPALNFEEKLDLRSSPYSRAVKLGIIDDRTGLPTGKRVKRLEDLPQEVQDLYASVAGINADIKDLGGKPKKHQGIVNRIFDVLSRGNYAVAEFTRAGNEADRAGKGFFGGLGSAGHGFISGLAGTKKTHFSDVLREMGAKNNAATKVGGFALDILLDPTTYIGVGIAGKGGIKTAEVAEKIARTNEAASKIARLKIPGVDETLAQQALGRDVIGKSIGPAASSRVIRNANSLISKAPKAEQKHLAEIVYKNTSSDIKRTLQLSMGWGKNRPTVNAPEIVNAIARKPLKALGRTDVSQRVLNTFNKGFNSSWKIHPEIQQLKLASGGNSQRLIQYNMRKIDRSHKGISETDRTDIVRGFINRAPVPRVNAHGEDVSKYFDTEIGRIAGYLDPSIGELSYTDLNRWLPDDMKLGKIKTSDPVEIIRQSMTNWGTKDSAQILLNLNISLAQALNRRALMHAVRDEFGIPFSHAGVKELTDKHGFRTITGREDFKEFGNYVFHPDLASSVEQMAEVLSRHDKIDEFARFFDKVQGVWKTGVTTYNPGFHIRNSIGDAFVAWMNGVNNPKVYNKSWKVLRGVKAITEDPAMERAMLQVDPVEAIRNRGTNMTSPIMRIPDRWTSEAGGKYLTAEQVWAYYIKNGLKQGFVSTDVRRVLGKADPSAVAEVGGKIHGFVSNVSEAREDLFRLGHFIDAMSKSKASTIEEAAREAAQQVRKFHFDYTDVTAFEKTWLRRVMPFYKWQRKALPLMIELLFARPGKAAAVPKFMRLISELSGYEGPDSLFPSGDDVLPEWIREAGSVPIFRSPGNNTVYWKPSNPMGDVAAFTTNPRQMVSSLTPAIKIPFELATKRQTYIDAPIPDSKLEYAAKQTPLGNVLWKQFKDKRAQEMATESGEKAPSWRESPAFISLMQYLTAAGLLENTPITQRADLKRQQRKAGQQRKKLRDEQGLPSLR